MKHSIKIMNNYCLHHYKTTNYKTIEIKLIFRKKIKKEDITITNLLFDVLFSGTKYHPNIKSLNIEKEELYGIDISSGCKRVGNYFHKYMYLEVLNDKYTEKNNFEKSIKLFSEILLDPLVKNNSFDKDIVEREININRDYYKNIKENPSLYAYIRSNEIYNKKSIISYRTNGYLEDLNKINNKNLYEYYKDFIKTNLLDIIVVGNIEFDEISELIDKYFNKINNIKIEDASYYLNDKLLNKTIINKEKANNKESILVMMYRGSKLTKFEKNYVLKIYSNIIGEKPDSKLFEIIREKYSLCYYIQSSYNCFDNTLYILASIDKNNYEITKEKIKNIIDISKDSLISKEDISKAIIAVNIQLKNKLYNNTKISNYIEELDIYKNDTINIQIKNYQKINKKEITSIVNKLQLESIFLLEGDGNE